MRARDRRRKPAVTSERMHPRAITGSPLPERGLGRRRPASRWQRRASRRLVSRADVSGATTGVWARRRRRRLAPAPRASAAHLAPCQSWSPPAGRRRAGSGGGAASIPTADDPARASVSTQERRPLAGAKSRPDGRLRTDFTVRACRVRKLAIAVRELQLCSRTAVRELQLCS